MTGMAHESDPNPPSPVGRPRPRDGAGLLGRIQPNSRAHWSLLLLGVAGGVVFTVTYLVEGALRPGYDWLRQPVSALSLGPSGWVQSVNFVAFGLIGVVTSFASRPTLAPGLGAAWYPRLRMLSGLALMLTGLFSQDPGLGYPVGEPAPAHASVHATIHILVSYISLVAIVAQLIILGLRFAREPGWKAWSVAATAAAILMMASLATFGALLTHNGPAGAFEKLGGLIPTLFGIAFTARLVARHDARVSAGGRSDGPAGTTRPRYAGASPGWTRPDS